MGMIICTMNWSILIDRLHVGECSTNDIVTERIHRLEYPSSEKKLHTNLIPVFLDISLFEELEGTCLVRK